MVICETIYLRQQIASSLSLNNLIERVWDSKRTMNNCHVCIYNSLCHLQVAICVLQQFLAYPDIFDKHIDHSEVFPPTIVVNPLQALTSNEQGRYRNACLEFHQLDN